MIADLDHRTVVLAAIINYNGAGMTLNAVKTILPQVQECRGRLMVIDNASRGDDLRTLEAGLPGSITLVSLPVNGGYAAACNLACQMAHEHGVGFVWLLNNDLELEPGALPRLLAAARADPTVAVAVPVTVEAHDGARVLGAGLDVDLWRGRVHHRFQRRAVEDLPDTPFDVQAVEGSCPLIQTAVLENTGLLDEAFFMYWEDTDWSLRASQVGYRLRVVPTARVRHMGSQSFAPLTRLEWMMRNRIRFMRIQGSVAQQSAFMAYFLALWLPAYFVTRLIPQFGVGPGGRAAWHAVRWNVRDARERGRWRLSREDQVIPGLRPPS